MTIFLETVSSIEAQFLESEDFVHADIDAYECECIDDEGKLVHGFGSFILGGEGQTGKMMSNKLLDNAQLQKLQNILQNDIQMDFEYELELNARDYLLFENYRMACVEIQSAVEYVISKIIRHDLEKKGKNESDISNILNLGLAQLKPYLKDATTSNIFQSNEYAQWFNCCYKVRNAVIHKGRVPTEQESIDAVTHGKNYIAYLQNLRKP